MLNTLIRFMDLKKGDYREVGETFEETADREAEILNKLPNHVEAVEVKKEIEKTKAKKTETKGK